MRVASKLKKILRIFPRMGCEAEQLEWSLGGDLLVFRLKIPTQIKKKVRSWEMLVVVAPPKRFLFKHFCVFFRQWTIGGCYMNMREPCWNLCCACSYRITK